MAKCMTEQSGYSLVEVLVALVFIGVAIAALFTAIMQGVYVQKAAEMEADASDLANQAVEKYRSYFNNGNYDYLVTRSAEEEEAELAALGRSQFRRTIAVTQSGTAPDRTWTIAATVTYDLKGKSRNVTCRTLFAE
ncbi:MAG TPA: type II secretion system protein [Bacillota bacterium]|nr:type II secretion system protein [Bacillota bacterium]